MGFDPLMKLPSGDKSKHSTKLSNVVALEMPKAKGLPYRANFVMASVNTPVCRCLSASAPGCLPLAVWLSARGAVWLSGCLPISLSLSLPLPALTVRRPCADRVPTVQAGVNGGTVRRSNAINGYGLKVVYSEGMEFKGLFATCVYVGPRKNPRTRRDLPLPPPILAAGASTPRVCGRTRCAGPPWLPPKKRRPREYWHEGNL